MMLIECPELKNVIISRLEILLYSDRLIRRNSWGLKLGRLEIRARAGIRRT